MAAALASIPTSKNQPRKYFWSRCLSRNAEEGLQAILTDALGKADAADIWRRCLASSDERGL